MIAQLKRTLGLLVIEEKRLFKSATIYVGAVITALPTMAQWAHDNWTQVAPYIPPEWHGKSLHIIGAVVLLARMRSMVKP